MRVIISALVLATCVFGFAPEKPITPATPSTTSTLTATLPEEESEAVTLVPVSKDPFLSPRIPANSKSYMAHSKSDVAALLVATPATFRGNFASELLVVNQPPLAQTDSYTVHGGRQVVPIENDSDPDGDYLTTQSIVTQPQHGSLVQYVNVINYGANYGYIGSDSFTYKVCDSWGACSIGTVNITVVNQPPVAATDSYTVHGARQLGPTQNDSDPDIGDSLTMNSLVVVTQAQHGSLTTYPGTFTYGAHYGYIGSDSFTYRICDNLGACSIGTINITVVNQLPVAPADSYILSSWIQVVPRENDSDPDSGDSLRMHSIVTQPQHGSLNPNNPDLFTYVAHSGYTGSDSFTYKVCDNWGGVLH